MLPGLNTTPDTKPDFGAELDWDHPLAQGMALCCLCNEENALRSQDLAGAHHITYASLPTVVGTRIGAGLKFDGSANYGPFADAGLPAGSSPWTIAALLQCVHSGASPYVFSYGTASGDQNLAIGHLTFGGEAGVFRFTTNAGGVDSVASIGDGVPRLCAATYDGATIRLYIDGKADGALSVTLNLTLTGTGYVGRYNGGGHFWDDTLLGLWMWDRVLTAEELRAHTAEPFCMILPPAGRQFFLPDGGALLQLLTETLGLTDTRLLNIGKTAAETLALIETRQIQPGKGLTETLALADTRLINLARILSESLGLIDASSAQILGLALRIAVILARGDGANIFAPGDSVKEGGGAG